MREQLTGARVLMPHRDTRRGDRLDVELQDEQIVHLAVHNVTVEPSGGGGDLPAKEAG